MPILRPAPPRDIEAAFLRGLPAFLALSEKDVVIERFAGPRPVLPTLKELGIALDKLTYQEAHQTFALGLNDVARRAGARSAEPAGWRFFAGSESGPLIMGRVSFRKHVGWKLTGVHFGEGVRETLKACRALPAFDLDYELRALLVPGLNLESFWLLSGGTEADDLVAPLRPVRPGGAHARARVAPVYPMSDFLTEIQSMAAQQL